MQLTNSGGEPLTSISAAASFTIALAPQGSAAATFTFQCGNLPAHAVCSFNPATDSVAANATSNVTVQIATGQAASVAQLAHQPPWSGWPAVLALVWMPFAWRKRRSLLLAISALLLACSLSSCSGAGGGTNTAPPAPQPGAIPPGTYSIVVKATSAGLSHTAAVTLTVD